MTIMWIIIMLTVILAAFAGLVYLISRIRKFKFVDRLSREKKVVSILISSIIVIGGAIFFHFVLGYVNMCVILITLTLIWLLVDLVAYIIRKVSKNNIKLSSSVTGCASILITFVYLAVGMFLAHHVFVTEYTITTDKDVDPLRIVMFSDSHMGTTFDGEGFAKHMDTVNSLEPDIVLIPGDYVDGSSRYEDIVVASKALGAIKSKYGIYFSFGNHDQNVYGEDLRRNFTEVQLRQLFSENGVVILEDGAVDFAEGYTLIGRKDATVADRQAISDLMNGISGDDFVIDMNHQPNDYANEAASGVDLVVSGHTHGGQLFPINEMGVWIGANDKTYGYEKRGNTNFIVSSGISDWALDFKTGCKSEIVVINVIGDK